MTSATDRVARALAAGDVDRRLARIRSHGEARDAARRRLPRGVFDYVDGGADDEITLRRNRTAFEGVELLPRHGRFTAEPTLARTVLGIPLSMPVLTAPCGGMRLVHPHGDVGVAAAAAEVGIAHIATTASGFTLEEIAEAPGPKLFQAYKVGSTQLMRTLVGRARDAGYLGLVATIDSVTSGHRERDYRNGFSYGMRIDLPTMARTAPKVATRPRWLAGFVADGMPFSIPNTAHGSPGGRALDLSALTRETGDTLGPTWEDVDWMRANWSGPLVVKGVLTVADAERARDAGADAIVVSNHGGRQLDGSPATLAVLPAIAAAVGGEVEVLLDSGIRRGADVAAALALGADAVLVGRLPAWGLAAGGAAGVRHVLGLLRAELIRTLQLAGSTGVDDLEPIVARSGETSGAASDAARIAG